MRAVTSGLLLALAGCAPEAAVENKVTVAENVIAVGNGTALEYQVIERELPVVNEVAVPDNVTTEAAAGANDVPAEVQKFIERREGCEHWAGEPDFDAARRKQIEEAVAELCPGIDTQLAALRKRFAKDPQAIAALADFQPLGMDD